MVSQTTIHRFQNKIFDRYATHKRDLPRRDTFDTYQVVVSEMMLQQTQVERVIPKYMAFLDALPTLHLLAQADKLHILKLRSGLGFNSRAIRLQLCAQKIIELYQGKLPDERDLLIQLPGIGAYSSAALLAFVYNISVPVIDTNIRRVLIAELHLSETISRHELEQIAGSCIPTDRSNDRHNALMDYGAMVLTSKMTGIKPLSKQSRFAGSRRQIRGKILKHLITHGTSPLQRLIHLYPHTESQSIIAEMTAENLITHHDGQLSIQ